MNSVRSPVLHFGEYVLDVERRALQSGAREIALRPQAMEVLCYLARNPGRPVSKEEIFREIWPGVFVTDDSLVQCIGDIRRALGDDDHRIVKTVPRRGYLFAGGVAPDERAIAPTTGLAGGPPTRSRMHEIRLALIGAAAIVAIWAIVHWVVSAR